MAYVALYRRYNPRESIWEVMFEVPMAMGQALISAQMACDPFLSFCGVNIEGTIKKEVQKQLKKVQ
jgi:hypothetical protein